MPIFTCARMLLLDGMYHYSAVHKVGVGHEVEEFDTHEEAAEHARVLNRQPGHRELNDRPLGVGQYSLPRS